MSTTRRSFLLQTGAAGAVLSSAAANGAPGPKTNDPAPKDARNELLSKAWTARWISVPDLPRQEFAVVHFRRRLDLREKPGSFVVHVSADNRYQLFVNGKRVLWGPARGDQFHWRFETLDIAPHLEAGKNILAAVVWNYGPEAPEAQTTVETAFVLQGDTEAEQAADTGVRWKCAANASISPIHFSHGDLRGYFVAGPGEKIDGAKYPWGWETPGFDDSGWPDAIVVAPAAGRDARDVHSRWMLTPRNIPLMEESPERIREVRRATGPALPREFPLRTASVQIPAGTKASYLLDQTYLTTGYPELVVTGGKGAKVQMRYAECLQIEGGKAKGNRNEIEGKDFIGYHDEFVSDGGKGRVFRPLWWRTWRYVELNIETAGEPLVIDDLRASFTAYPFVRHAEFAADDASLTRILDVGWRTARLCAHETYMDCPYYEQLQYVGDTRIQSLISVFNTGDTRLMRNAIELINDSRISSGATMSRYPTRLQQFIPSFSLWWIGMVHDYWRYAGEAELIRRMLPGVRSVLGFFEGHQKANGSLGPLPWWRFMDWADEWKNGDAPQDADGSSAPFDMQLVLAYDWAADLEAAAGIAPLGEVYRQRAAALRRTAQQLYWDAGRRYYADTPRKADWSQQTNTLAILAGVVQGPDARDLLVRTLEDRKLVQCTLYFRHYLYEAMNKVGEGDRYIEQLADWHTMIDKYGLTTFSEVLDAPDRRSRSDCHAWSASPNYELLHTVLGVESAGPQFGRVLVRPFLGRLNKASGSVPHPKGKIEVALERRGAGVEASVTLPAGVSGDFDWKGSRRILKPGKSSFVV